MNITKEQIKKDSKRKIGHLNGSPVYELQTIGGLNMILMAKSSGGPKLLALAPHRGLARFIAKQKDPDLFIDELSKNEDLNSASFMHLVPYWSNVTDIVDLKLED